MNATTTASSPLRRLSLALLCACAGLLAFATVPAAAAGTLHPYLTAFGDLNFPYGDAVDNSKGPASGDIYVAAYGNPGNEEYGSLQRFKPDGSPAPFSALGPSEIKFTPNGRMGPVAVAVDPSNGNFYVTDRSPTKNTPATVDVFESSGQYLRHFTPVGQPGAQTPKPFEPFGVAVDPASGDVYVADDGNNAVYRFHPDGTYVSQFSGSGEHAVSSPATIAVDAGGNVFVNGSKSVEKFDPEGNYLSTLDSNSPSAVAIDRGTGEIEVWNQGAESGSQYDAAGNLENHFGGIPVGTIQSFGLAVDGNSHRIYVLAPYCYLCGGTSVKVLDGILPGPIVIANPASEIGQTSATLNGTVNPRGFDVNASDPANCHFEWGATKEYGHTAPCEPAEDLGAGEGAIAVHAELKEELTPGTTYHFRLDAKNSEEEAKSSDRAFNTLGPPTVDETSASEVTGVSAVLATKVNPDGFDTTYHFEYVDEAAFQADGFAEATSAPAPDADLGAGTEERTGTEAVSGLSPDTTYHLRVLATNSQGAVAGPEQTFTTAHGFGFPSGPAGFDANATEEDGSIDNQAGSHPYALTTDVNFNLTQENIPDGDPRDVHVSLPPGLIGNPSVVGQCTEAQFKTKDPKKGLLDEESCPDDSQIGIVGVKLRLAQGEDPTYRIYGVYNLAPPFGAAAQFGFNPVGTAVRLTPHVRTGDYGLTVDSLNTSQLARIYGVKVTIWGVPWVHSHDGERGECLSEEPSKAPGSIGFCPVSGSPQAYLTLPKTCEAPGPWSIVADSWQDPAPYLPNGEPDLSSPAWKTSDFLTHDAQGNPQALEGCNQLPFGPTSSAKPTTDSAYSSSGLAFNLDVDDPGLANPKGLAQSDIRKAVVTLPEGMSVNPSAGAGLLGCSPADFARETLKTAPGEGCPNSSKVGNVTIETPLLPKPLGGALYIAKPFDNPFNSLIALYMVIKDPETGILVRVPGKVTANEQTGQLTTTFDDLPQLPFSHFNLSFSQGQTAPLVTPPACGTYQVKADLTPWSNPQAVLHGSSEFTITKGVGGGPCPSGGVPPFNPQLTAGSIDPTAGAFSPFYVRMSRRDGEQEITHFSSQLPPGLSGKLAGVGVCSDAAIEAAKSRTGAEEQEHPSCPAASEIGHTFVGAGVGGVLTYAPGKVYLAGPYHGSPISIAAITAARVGPFDLGTVVVRSAFKIDPETAKVSVDSAGSDPIPHIIDGIPVHVRDIRVYIDRQGFTLNPTSCDPLSVTATLTGSGADFANPADDAPATLEDPFQAANCARLPFGPKLSFKLKGATKRSGHPALTATLTARPGEANIAKAAVTLPHSEFLDQAHIKTVCTRVQFAQDQCPAGSVYGFARAVTPLLDQPLEGPVYLRSSNNPLPDLVVDLGGQIHVVLDGRVDSVNGGIRNTFEAVPDAPVKTFTLTMQGGRKGLLENSKNLCESVSRATVRLTGQNGKTAATNPKVIAQGCAKQGKRHKRGKRGAHRAHHG